MKALAGVLAVLLAAVCFAGAVSADDYSGVPGLTANFSVNTTELNVQQNAYKIWQNESAADNLYYIDLKDGNNSMIPVNVTGYANTDNFLNLAGYNISFEGDLTTALGNANGTNWKFDNITLGSGGSLVFNNWHIAKVIDAGGLDAEVFKNGVDFVNITILNAGGKTGSAVLKHGTNYSLGIRSDANLALVNKSKLSELTTMDYIQLALAKVDSTFFNSSKFTIFAQNTSRAVEYDFNDFIKFDVDSTFTASGDSNINPATVYLYSEHDGGIDYLNLTLDEATYNNKYNTEDLAVESTAITAKTAGAIVGNEYLNYTLTLQDTGTPAQGPLNITLNKFASAPTKNVTGFENVNVSKWKVSAGHNNVSNNGLDAGNWSFNTNLSFNVTVRGGTVDYSNENPDGRNWDSWVKFNASDMGVKVLGDNSTVNWAFQDIVYTNMSSSKGKITENKYVVNGLKSGQKAAIVNGANLTVTNNSVNDGTQIINISLLGYRAGDANLNNVVDIVDSTTVGVMVLKFPTEMDAPNTAYWASTDNATAAQAFLKQNHNALIYMDCNKQGGDGSIDVDDIRAINQYLVGLEPWKLPQ